MVENSRRRPHRNRRAAEASAGRRIAPTVILVDPRGLIFTDSIFTAFTAFTARSDSRCSGCTEIPLSIHNNYRSKINDITIHEARTRVGEK
jgi:hypothetical protein